MDSWETTKDPVRLAVRQRFLDYDPADRAAYMRAELAAQVRRQQEAVARYPAPDGGEHLLDYARAEPKQDDLYQDYGGLFPLELRRGSVGSRRSSIHSDRRPSTGSVRTFDGWDSQELGSWSRTLAQPSRRVSNTGRGRRPSLALELREEEAQEGSDDDEEKDEEGEESEIKVDKNNSVMSWTTYVGDSSQELRHLRLLMPEDGQSGMPFIAARGNDAGARVPPPAQAPAVVPRMSSQLATTPGQPASVPTSSPPATSSWSQAFGGASASSPPPYYPGIPGLGQSPAALPPYVAEGWHAGGAPGYFGGWPAQSPTMPYGGLAGASKWAPGTAPPGGAWANAGSGGRAAYPGQAVAQHAAAQLGQAPRLPPGARTTVMLRNMPDGFTRDNLTAILDRAGFPASYDFVYMPMNFRTKASFGYAFVNMVTPEEAQRCHDAFQGFATWGVATDKICEVSWSDMHQGLAAHIDRYRNSPVMHESVPDEYKPVMYENGMRVAFPPPTKKLRQPRIRRSTEDGDEDDLEDNQDPAGLPVVPHNIQAAWLAPPPPPPTNLRRPR